MTCLMLKCAAAAMAGVLALGLGATATPAAAEQWQARVVSQKPFAWTPHVLDGFVQAIAVIGDVAVAGGRFSSVQEASSGKTLNRNNLFAFKLGTGEVLPNFAPRINGFIYALAGGAAGTVYVGGAFNHVNNQNDSGLARLNLSDGSAVP